MIKCAPTTSWRKGCPRKRTCNASPATQHGRRDSGGHRTDQTQLYYPCISECGHLVHHSYKVCPHCHGPKTDHLVGLLVRVATGLVGADVPEAKIELKARAPQDFDARLFVSGAASAYPQIFSSCLEDWTSRTQEKDLTGEVLSFITPAQMAHYNW